MGLSKNRQRDGFVFGPLQLVPTPDTSLRKVGRALYRQLLELKVTAAQLLEKDFAKLKHELYDGVIVRLPNPIKQFVVQTDANIHAVGSVRLDK